MRRQIAEVHKNRKKTFEKCGRSERKGNFEFAYVDHTDGGYLKNDFSFDYD